MKISATQTTTQSGLQKGPSNKVRKKNKKLQN